ncbi:9c0ec6a7-6d42-49a1-96c6-c5b287bccaab [Sclerotinia trifoliorum]|uniref:9c0ec6a7-6d42-49a1-96c6-c5b287bccaab n=1 Tax=Sclerotinia trifoliorum TaxID=28548 RepID=A0A8H2W723_9HELO|nr:9c0ec6a7-6d42-49a1-96c6-c5b287bccaab [Sclerotinia trifoliorum]
MGKSKLTTHKQRVAALRARLSGNAPTRTSRSRCPRNGTISFRRTFSQRIEIYATDEEVAEYGQIYTEMKTKTRSLNGHSGALRGISLNINDSTPYTEADMVKDAQNNQEEILARPENKILDITATGAINEDGCVDDEEYSTSLLEAGSAPIKYLNGSTSTPAAASNSEEALINAEASSYRLQFQRFKCHRKQDDSMFRPRNEIYWAVAAGADGHDKNSFKTGEYGSINTGNVQSMGGLDYWTGSVQEHLVGHIVCWEADGSDDSSPYNKMVQGLRDIARFAIDAAVQATEAGDSGAGAWGSGGGDTGKGAAILALVAICTALVAELLAFFRNDDDFVFRREIAFTKSGLDAWTQKPNKELSFMFDGGSEGKHELWISCNKIPRPDGSLRAIRKIKGSAWTSVAAPTGNSPHGMTMADHHGELVGVFRKTDNTMLWTKWSKSTGRWSAPLTINNGARTTHRPALCTFNDRLWCIYRATSGNIYVMSTDNLTSWTSPINAAGGGLTSDRPSICGYNGKLYSVFRGNNNRTYWMDSNNGSSWSRYQQFSGNATISSPALWVHNGIPHVSILDINTKYYVSWFENGSWSAFNNNTGSVIKSGPATVSLDDTLLSMSQGPNYHVTGIDRPNGKNPSQYHFTSHYSAGDMGMCKLDQVWCVFGLAVL